MHSRRSVFWLCFHPSSISLEPFALPALPGFIAHMVPLTPVGTLPDCRQVSLLHGSNLLTILSPTTPRRPEAESGCFFGRTVVMLPKDHHTHSGRVPHDVFLGFATVRLARHDDRPNRVRHLRTGHSPPVALHPSSPRRGYGRLRGAVPPRRGLSPRWFYPLTNAPNGRLQQIAANRFSMPQDVIAILLQGFVRRALYFTCASAASTSL